MRSKLLTLLNSLSTAAEHLYNEAHIRTRNVVEHMFEIWKRRFPFLSVGICTKLELAQTIIVACVVLRKIVNKTLELLTNGGYQCPSNKKIMKVIVQKQQKLCYK